MKPFFTLVLLCVNFMAHAQELIKTDWEQGYAKDGKKYSVWQYFNSKKEPELVINHTTGRVMFISKDTSNYIIFKDGQWITSKLDIHPVPVEGSQNFYQAIRNYPLKKSISSLEGKVVVLFEVDTLGHSTNYSIAKNTRVGCDSAILQCLKDIDQKWIPARAKGKKYPTRFAIVVEYRLQPNELSLEDEEFDLANAKLLSQIAITNNDRIFNFVEDQAEFIGGQEGFLKYLSKNLRYPPSAARMGLEGKVYVKFIVEPDGSITNAEVLKGFDGACDREALRVVSIMPKWKPGTQSGRAVRSYFTQALYFKLAR